MAQTWEQLQAMSDDEVREVCNRLAPDVGTGLAWWRDELLRRDNARVTRQLLILTVLATFSAVVSVIVSIIALIVAAG